MRQSSKGSSLATSAERARPTGGLYRRQHSSEKVGLSPTPIAVLCLAGLATYFVQDWLAGLGILLLWAIWLLLFEDGEPPVLAMAVSFQWMQVTLGLYYFGLTGRELEAMYASDYRTMVLIGLGCVSALLVGLWGGLKLGLRKQGAERALSNFAFSWRTLFAAYVASIFLSALLSEVAWHVPVLTQGILAIGFLRLGILFLIFRRLTRPRVRWNWFLAILALELVLGFSGFFASFREPLVLAALALVECFDRRSASHWFRLGGVGAAMVILGVLWIGIRATYRQEFARDSFAESRTERLETIGSLSSDWIEKDLETMVDDLDNLVSRLWAVYYPAIAVSRVPDVLPHEGGALMRSALMHLVTPRILFPEKQPLPSDSELVRKYTGIPVASIEQNTSIAFGYAAESYVDFGLPWMFLPSLLYGLFMGLVYRGFYNVMHHRELVIGLVTVVFWLSLYLFERSWIKTFGLTFTLIIYLGGFVCILDRYLLGRALRHPTGGLGVARRDQRPQYPQRGRVDSASASRF